MERNQISRDIQPVSTARLPTRDRFDEFTDTWGARYPAAIAWSRNAWEQFIPFLDHDAKIRWVIRTTTAIESLSTRFRHAIRARGHSPTAQAAIRCFSLLTRSLDPTLARNDRYTGGSRH